MSQPPPPPGPPPPAWGYYPQPQQNQLAMWSMIIGIVSIPVGMCCGSFVGIGPIVLGAVALALGIISRGQIGRSYGTQTGSSMGLAGIIMGSIAIVMGLAFLALFFTFANPVGW